MPNTSASGGFLTPNLTPTVLEDDALVNFFQEWVVGLTGLTPANVRPRWQAEPPNIPADGINWAAIGIVRRSPDVFASEEHVATGPGYDVLRKHEILHLICSFYGPNAETYSGTFRDGMQIAQNREILSLNRMGLVESGEPIVVPELLKEKWLYKTDLPFSIKREIIRNYAVQNVLSSQTSLVAQSVTATITETIIN